MRSCDVIVVGGGPAGASAARRLKRAGAEVLILDKELFPRLKLCAGWVTPEVIRDTGLIIEEYPHRFHTFRRLHWHAFGVHLRTRCEQYSIRRVEFDAWLLERSGAECVQHTVRTIEADGEGFVIDGQFRCRHLIGAGGTGCPVHRQLFRQALPRARGLQTVTLELEFPFEWQDPDCHLWFFEHGLPGYSWSVPKGNGWLNVGVGAMAQRLKERNEDIWLHWQHLLRALEQRQGVKVPLEPTGYSYYLRGALEDTQRGNAYLVGDSVGLATRFLGEGIGPAIRSGLRAAESILTGKPYQIADVTGASLGNGWVSRSLEWLFSRGLEPAAAPQASAPAA
jgi:flavin-dependent dehydrogenase